MKTLGERLKFYIDNQGISMKKFCEANDLSYTNLTMVVKNERSLGMNVLNQIKIAIPEIDSEWLLFGTDRQNVRENENHEIIPSFSEPGSIYGEDPFTKTLLTYL
ncbi:MAG: XRE family transcriptional regulator [Chryseobacterium sp.]|nr:MAG: XRE family transcriptional regulator [Chryseobacterium sp.]